MLVLLITLTLFNQTGTLDIIYDNFYQNQNLYKEQVDLVTDKDFYYPGESVSIFMRVGSIKESETIRSKWALVYLFDDNRKVINYVRVYLKSGKAETSLLIPESIKSGNIYLSIATAYTPNTPAKYLRLLTTDNLDQPIAPEDKIGIKTKNIFLTPNQENEISISTTSIVEKNATIVDANNVTMVEFRLRERKLVTFTPIENQSYFLVVNNQKLELPKVKPTMNIKADIVDTKLRININNLETNVNNNTLLVISDKKIVWLSYVNNNQTKVEFTIGNPRNPYIFCFLLDKNLNVIDRDILNTKQSRQELYFEKKNDTLYLSPPKDIKNLPLLAKVIESNYQINRVTFSTNELNDLSFYGTIPNNIYFLDNKEKMNWLNYYFTINIKALIYPVKPTPKLPIPKIVYHLPDNTKIDNQLRISAIDFKGKIINFELQDKKIIIDPNEFEYPESLLVLSANYKNKKLKLTKDTTEILTYIGGYVDNFFKNKAYLQYETEQVPSDYLQQLKRLSDITVLKGVTVTSKRNKVKTTARGRTISYEDIVLNDYTNTALSLLPQIGITSLPDPDPRVPGYIYSTKDFYTLTSPFAAEQTFIRKPLELNIFGPQNREYYVGWDFNELSEYPAEWVERITKIRITKVDINSRNIIQQEVVEVFIKPGLRKLDNSIAYEKIFTRATINDNTGIIYWNYDSNGEKDQIEIPLKDTNGSVSWTLQFFEPNGTILEYKGIYEHSDER